MVLAEFFPAGDLRNLLWTIVRPWLVFEHVDRVGRARSFAADVTELTIGGFNAVPVRSAMVQRSLRQVDRRGRGWARQAMVNMFAIARC